MKKIIKVIVAFVLIGCACLSLVSCQKNSSPTISVNSNGMVENSYTETSTPTYDNSGIGGDPYSSAAIFINDLFSQMQDYGYSMEVNSIQYALSDGESLPYDVIFCNTTYSDVDGNNTTEKFFALFDGNDYIGFFSNSTENVDEYLNIVQNVPYSHWNELDIESVLNDAGRDFVADGGVYKLYIPSMIDNKEIYNSNDLKITIVSYDSSSNKMEFQIENTSNKDWDFTIKSYAVNGIMVDTGLGTMSTNVPAGSIAKNTLEPDIELLSSFNMDQPEYFDFLFWTYDNSKMFKDFDTGQITVETDQYSQRYGITANPDASDSNFDFYGINDGGIYCFIKNNNDFYCSANFDDLKLNKYALQNGDYNFYDNYSFYILSDCWSVREIVLDSDFSLDEQLESISFSFPYEKNGSYSTEKRLKISMDLKKGD